MSDESTAQGVFAVSVKSDGNAITTSNAAHSPRNDNTVKRSAAIAKPIKYDSKRKKAAFTLAEVLITLAIIGIVAVLTIPTLIQNFQQEAWDTASEVFQRKLEESLKVMNVQGTLAGYTTTEAFVDELSKHIKITKICKNDDITSCFEDKVYWGSGDAEPEEVDMTTIKEAKHFGQDEWETETIGVQFANGTNAVIAYNPECKQDPYSNQVTGTSCLAILYDTSAYKNPNTGGKDLRGINIKKLGRVCAVEVDGICFSTAVQINEPMTTAECLELKDDLGIDLGSPTGCCYYYGSGCCDDSNFYWGTAAKVCGGVDHLPSEQQLRALSKYMYNSDDFILFSSSVFADMGITSDEQLNELIANQPGWDAERVAALGISPVGGGNGEEYFRIYGNHADSVFYDMAEFMKSDSVNIGVYQSRDSEYAGVYAVCVE